MKTKQKVNKRRKRAKLRWVQDVTRNLIHIPTIKSEHETDLATRPHQELTSGVTGEELAGKNGKTWGHMQVL